LLKILLSEPSISCCNVLQWYRPIIKGFQRLQFIPCNMTATWWRLKSTLRQNAHDRSNWRAMPRRNDYAVPPPSIAHFRGHGVTRVRVHCVGACGHCGVIDLDGLLLDDATPFVQIPRRRPFVCSGCGNRRVQVMPDWPLRPGMHSPAG
jgi:hypothetical protein